MEREGKKILDKTFKLMVVELREKNWKSSREIDREADIHADMALR